MHQKANRALAGIRDAADCNAQRLSNPYKPVGAKNKAPTTGSSRRLTTSRRIEVVHHCTAAGVQSWHVVLTENASRKSVAAFASKCEAIEQLGFISEKLSAIIVGRGSAVSR
jgi:hypothetical protein